MNLEKTLPYYISQIISEQEKEEKAFQEAMNLLKENGVNYQTRDEFIGLWVRATEASKWEARLNSFIQRELNEQEYKESQDEIHQAWRARLGLEAN